MNYDKTSDFVKSDNFLIDCTNKTEKHGKMVTSYTCIMEVPSLNLGFTVVF